MRYVDDNSIVNCHTLEANDSDYFVCDKMILPTIIELNRKGYITSECCSGHSDKMNIQDPYWDSSSIIELDENEDYEEQIKKIIFDGYKKGEIILPNDLIGNKLKVSFLRTYQMCTYIFFPKKYDLQPPEGFGIKQTDTITCIEKWYTQMKSPGRYKTNKELESEISYYNNILYEWALSLNSILDNEADNSASTHKI